MTTNQSTQPLTAALLAYASRGRAVDVADDIRDEAFAQAKAPGLVGDEYLARSIALEHAEEACNAARAAWNAAELKAWQVAHQVAAATGRTVAAIATEMLAGIGADDTTYDGAIALLDSMSLSDVDA